MKTLIIAVMVLISAATFAQTPYQDGMNQGFALWKSGKATEAAAQFERIAQVEKDNWIPAYYQAFVLTTSAFTASKMEEKTTLIATAKNILTNSAQDNNSEWLTLKAMNLLADLTTDPMTKGRTLSPTITALYQKAIQLDATNPRAVLGLAEFNINSKKYFHQDTSKDCEDVKKALDLFENQKASTPYAPSWGKDRAEELIKNCGK